MTSSRTVQTLPCAPEMPVRYLTIRHDKQKRVGFCEVVVNGYQYKGKIRIFERFNFNFNQKYDLSLNEDDSFNIQ